MKILSWNILASEWIEKEYYPTVKDFSIMDRSKRIQLILKKLTLENADVMLLQEVMDLDYDILYKYFQHTYYVSSLRPIRWDQTDSSSGNITLVRKTLCKTISESPLDFGVFVKADRLCIYNIHLDDVSVTKRIAQMNQIRPRIEKESQVIVGGDFNQEYEKHHPVYRFDYLKVHNKCVTYFVEKNMNIDNILTKGFVVSKDTCQFVPRTVTEGVSYYGSDHIPVTTTVY